MQPLKVADEAGRIAALERYEVLDTGPEAPFDKITLLVKKLFDVPVAMVSLIDSDRQWMKSVQGSNVCEVPRGIAFCAHTIQAAEPLVVADLSQDTRFMAHPLVIGEPFVRSYAGVPLRTPDGYNIGALCVIDMVPRHFDPSKVEILKSFASLVVDELELRRIAHNDHLTGALTRRAFLAEADKAIALFGRHRTQGALILLDLDRFKLVNDTYGHPTGDRVLRHIGQRCQEMLRAGDSFGRVGGEEFGILMRDVSEEAARQGAELHPRVIGRHGHRSRSAAARDGKFRDRLADRRCHDQRILDGCGGHRAVSGKDRGPEPLLPVAGAGA